jgi:hypothetical protein
MNHQAEERFFRPGSASPLEDGPAAERAPRPAAR